MMLIEEANVFDLEDSYAARMTDLPTYRLTIQQQNGLSKKIQDYGPTGPGKLTSIYNFIFSLRGTQDWK
jgi:hypothetical protein